MIVKIKKTIIKKEEIFEDVEMNFNQYIGYKISSLRKEKKLRQIELSKKINISRASLSNIESGKQSLGLEYLVKICEVLNCNSKDILNL